METSSSTLPNIFSRLMSSDKPQAKTGSGVLVSVTSKKVANKLVGGSNKPTNTENGKNKDSDNASSNPELTIAPTHYITYEYLQTRYLVTPQEWKYILDYYEGILEKRESYAKARYRLPESKKSDFIKALNEIRTTRRPILSGAI